jgi:hypothetical protein
MAINRRFRLPGASQGTPLPGAPFGPASPSQIRQPGRLGRMGPSTELADWLPQEPDWVNAGVGFGGGGKAIVGGQSWTDAGADLRSLPTRVASRNSFALDRDNPAFRPLPSQARPGFDWSGLQEGGFVPNELMIKGGYRDPATFQEMPEFKALMDRYGGSLKKNIIGINQFEFSDPNFSISEAGQAFAGLPGVKFAEPNLIRRAFPADMGPPGLRPSLQPQPGGPTGPAGVNLPIPQLQFDPAAKVDPVYAEMNRQDLSSAESTRTFNSPEFKKWERATQNYPMAGGHSDNQAYRLAAYKLSGGAQAWQLTPEELAGRNQKREILERDIRLGIGPWGGTPPGAPGPGVGGAPMAPGGPLGLTSRNPKFEMMERGGLQDLTTATPGGALPAHLFANPSGLATQGPGVGGAPMAPGAPGPAVGFDGGGMELANRIGMGPPGAPGPAAAGPIPPIPGVAGLPPTGQLTQQGLLPGGTTAVGGPTGVGSTPAANAAGGLFGLGDIDPSSPEGLRLLQMAANRINQTTPSGRLEFTGPGRSESELTLSPEMQRIFDLEVAAAVEAKLQGTAAIGSLDYGADFGASRDAATRAAFARGQGLLDPVFELQEKRRRTALLNRGIVEGSEAFRTDIRENIFDPREKAYLALAQESIGAGLKEFATLEDARTARVNQAKGLLGLGGAEVPELKDFFAPSEIDVIGAETTAIARENARLTAAANASSVAAANARADDALQAQKDAAKLGAVTTIGATGLAGVLAAGGGKAIVEGAKGLFGPSIPTRELIRPYDYDPNARPSVQRGELMGPEDMYRVPGQGQDAGGIEQVAFRPGSVPVDGGVQDASAIDARSPIPFNAQGERIGTPPVQELIRRGDPGDIGLRPDLKEEILGKPLADEVSATEATRDVLEPGGRVTDAELAAALPQVPPPADFLPYGPDAVAGLEGIGDMTAIASDAAGFGDLAVSGSPISGGLPTGSTGKFLGVPLDVNIAGTSIPTTAILAPLIGAFTGEKRGAKGAIEGAMKAGIPITIQLAAIAEATAASAAATAAATSSAIASGSSVAAAAAAGKAAGTAAASKAAAGVMGPAAAVAIPLAVFKIYNSITSAQKAKQEGKQVAERAKFSGTILGAITGATGHGTTHSFMSSPEFKVLSGTIGPDQLGKKGNAFLSKYKGLVGGSDVTKMTDADVVNTAVTTGGVLAHIVELPGMQEKFDQWYSGKISQDQFNKSSRAALAQFGRKNESEILEAHLSMRIMTQTEWDDLYNPGD